MTSPESNAQHYSHASVYEAMAAAYRETGYAQKTGEIKGSYGYTFASEADLIESVRPAMARHGLFIFPSGIRDLTTTQTATRNGGTSWTTRAVFQFTIAHESGSSIVVEAVGEGADQGDKDCPKAATIAQKYALRQAFCTATGDDPDNTASTEWAARAPEFNPDEMPRPGSFAQRVNGKPPQEEAPMTMQAVVSHALAQAGITNASSDAGKAFQVRFTKGLAAELGRNEIVGGKDWDDRLRIAEESLGRERLIALCDEVAKDAGKVLA